MSSQLPAILVLAPLCGALITALIGPRDRRICVPVVFASLLVSLCATLGLAVETFRSGPIDYFMGGWEKPLGIGIQLRVDALNAPVLIIIAIVALLVAIFSIRRADHQHLQKTPQFYTLYQLLCVGLFGMTITGDAFNLFVLVEVSSLTSYALIAMGSKPRGTVAAFNYIIMGTIGASFYLLGVGYLYLKTGSLNMMHIHDILQKAPDVAQARSVEIAFIFIMVGIWIKMAFFPLYGWLPNAYSYCPSTSACILAPLMTKVSVYVMIRMMYSVFGADWVFNHAGWGDLVVWLAVIAIIAGSVLALAQRELKKMLCYLIVAEVGYMVGGAWLADTEGWGLTGAVFHILADALMTLCLFLVACIFAKKLKAVYLDDLDGVFKKMPVTMIAFVIGAIAMIGVPPTAGFFSKFYLIRGGVASGHWEYVIALIISSLINAVLFFRILEIGHFGAKPADSHDHGHHHEDENTETQQGIVSDLTLLSRREAPATALVPLLLSAGLIIALGIFNGQVVELIRVYVVGG